MKFYLLLLIIVTSSLAGTVNALTQDDVNSILDGTAYYDPNAASSSCGTTTSSVSVPAGTLPAFIPEPYNGAFTQGANAHQVAPALVAAIFSEEHNLGGSETSPNTSNLPLAWASFVKSQPDPNSGWALSKVPNDGTEVWADGEIGAGGAFQFEPTTWRGLGYKDGDRDNLVVAADAAAKYLAQNGGVANKPVSSWKTAIYDYNHADWYVNSVIAYYNYYNSQPGASGGGGSTTISTSTPTGSCTAACNLSGASTTSLGSKTIVLDPGHAPGTDIKVDPSTNLAVMDYENDPEMQQVWDIAQKMKTKLEADGYNVVPTKNSVNDSSTDLKKRAETANSANAALVVSIHTTPGSKATGNDIFVPKVGEYLVTSDGKTKLSYSDQALASTDLADAQVMAQAREVAEGDTVRVGGYGDLYGVINRNEGGIIEEGTMLVSQYFAKVPWVYNEVYQDSSGASVSQKLQDEYATGMVNGIEKIVPLNGNTNSTPSSSSSGCAALCNSGQNNSALSPVRQQVVCLAQQELATWQSQPGYPHPSYAATGLLKYTGGSCSGNTCTGDVYEEWCADFASWIYNQAGYPFSGGESGGWRLPGVSSIQALGEQNGPFHWHPAGGGYSPKPGDLAIHGGNHVNIFISSQNGTYTYIGGDQGDGPYGTQNPPSGSIVSTANDSNSVTGYVSPD